MSNNDQFPFLYHLLSSQFTLGNRSGRQKIQNYRKIFAHSHCSHFLRCSELTVYTAGDWFCHWASSSQIRIHKTIQAHLQLPMSGTVSCAENDLYLQKHVINVRDTMPVHKKLHSRLSDPPEEKCLRTTFPQQSFSQLYM